MRLESDVKLDYKDVLIRPKRSMLNSRESVDLERKFTFRNFQPHPQTPPSDVHYQDIPIMASNMDGVGTFAMANALLTKNIFTCLVKQYSADELIEYFSQDIPARTEHVGMSIGIIENDIKKFHQVYKAVGPALKYVCIDVANGYSEKFVYFVKEFREKFPHIVIIAGNVATGEMTEELILSGADIVKVGIGPGSVCTTRIQTGIGFPQLSAVIECADAAHGLGGHVIADGGCVCPGDVAKAFAGGADFVMLGGILAGHDQGGGHIISKFFNINGEYALSPKDGTTYEPMITERKFVQFYGMSSDTANKKHFGGLKDYRSSEGRTVLIPYRGPVEPTIQDLLGGVRSTCTYAGAKKLKNLSKCTTFVRCTQQFNDIYANMA